MSNSLVDGLSIAVVGGGPIGLTTAKLLQNSGARVTVYERDESAQSRITGGTLDIHKGTGQEALEKAGLLQAYYQYARPTRERTADKNGTILRDDIPTQRDAYQRPEIDRNDLRAILLENLDEGTVIWDRQAVKIDKERNGYRLSFQNGTTAFADLVIIANGGLSSIRNQIVNVVPQYTGSFVIQGEVTKPEKDCPNFKQLSGGGNLVVLEEKKIVSTQTKRNGAIVFYIAFQAPEDWAKKQGLNFIDRPAVTGFLLDLFYTWHDSYKELFVASEAFTALAMKRMPLDQPWNTLLNISLVGDAAHLMPPFAGQGLNIGLLDALHLTDNLTSDTFSDLQSALLDYEQKMFGYASKAQKITSLMETSCYSENPSQAIEEVMNQLKSGKL